MQPLCNHNATSMQPLRNHYATTLCNHSATTMQPVQSRPSIRNLQNSVRYWNFFKILVPTQSDSGLWNFLKLISKMNWYTIVQINFSIKIEKFTGPCVCGWRLYLPSSPPVRAPSCNARAFTPTNLVGKAPGSLLLFESLLKMSNGSGCWYNGLVPNNGSGCWYNVYIFISALAWDLCIYMHRESGSQVGPCI